MRKYFIEKLKLSFSIEYFFIIKEKCLQYLCIYGKIISRETKIQIPCSFYEIAKGKSQRPKGGANNYESI